MSRDLERLQRFLNPEGENINIIEQCRIVAEALAPGGEYEENWFGLGEYLGIKRSKVYQMNKIHYDMIPSVKEWFKGRDYQANKTYSVVSRSVEGQEDFLKEQQAIEERGSNSLEPKVIKEENQ